MLTNGVWLTRRAIRRPTSRGSPRRRACGLLFGLLAERPEAPRELVDACRQHALPLLTLPIEVPFTAVSHAMADLQADGAPAGAGALGRPRQGARPRDRRGHRRARRAARCSRSTTRCRSRWSTPAGTCWPSRAPSARASTPPRSRRRWPGRGARRGRVRRRHGRQLFRVGALAEGDAALLCLRALVDLSAAEREALDQTARFLTVELARRAALHAIESRFAGELLEMLYDAARRGARAAGAAALVRDRRRRPLAVLSIAFADGEPTAPGLADVFRELLVRWGVPGVVPQGSDDAVAIVGWTEDAREVAARRRAWRCARPRVAGPARGASASARIAPATIASCGAACSRRARRGGSRSGDGAGRR